MNKVCERCGKTANMLSWETLCYSCMKDKALEDIQTAIECGDDPDTWSDDYVICPYCGSAYEQLGYDETPETYIEGCHEVECTECGKRFELETTVSYSWETRKKV